MQQCDSGQGQQWRWAVSLFLFLVLVPVFSWPNALLLSTCPCTSMLAPAHIPKSYLYPMTAWERNKYLPSLGVDRLTHICLIYPREVEILPHRWNQLRSPPLFPVNGEPFLSRQNRRSGLMETTASFAAPGLPRLKKRVCVLLRMEFLCFLLLTVPGRCSLPYINVCAQLGKKNAADRGGGCEMKKADPHSGFFCFLWMHSLEEPLSHYSWEGYQQQPVPAENNPAYVQCAACSTPWPFFTQNGKLGSLLPPRCSQKLAYRVITQDTPIMPFFHFTESSDVYLGNRCSRIFSYLAEGARRGRQMPTRCHCGPTPLQPG